MLYDVAVVGAGPSGLNAAVSLACEGWKVVVLEKADHVGGQIGCSHLVENVAGYPNGFSGIEFAQAAHTQATSYGVDILLGQEVRGIWGELGDFTLECGSHPHYYCRARTILLALGVEPRELPFDVVDATCKLSNTPNLLPANPGEQVLVYGGGNSAGQAAAYYLKAGCNVTLVSRRPVEETMDARWIRSIDELGVQRAVGKVSEVCNDTVVFTDRKVSQELVTHTVHAFLGGDPETAWLTGIELDARGYVVGDEYHATSVYGIFTCGDCESNTTKQFACALGGSAEAANAVGRCLSGL